MQDKQEKTYCGLVAILGAPNAGKSTLLNQLLGSKLAIVTPKAQTTRSSVRGICMQGQTQFVFIDTPGIFNADKRFEKSMVNSAWNGAADADEIIVLVDSTRTVTASTKSIIEKLKEKGTKATLVLNKTDIAKKEILLKNAQELDEADVFKQVFMISAQTGDGVDDLKQYLVEKMPESPWFYPEDQLGDISERLLASEITREKLFLSLSEELPYSLTVETEKFEQQKNGSIKLYQIIYVERESQKKIVLGKQGQQIKAIGKAAREELSHLWDTQVHLFLFVKVRENWKENREIYQYLGLDYE